MDGGSTAIAREGEKDIAFHVSEKKIE